MKVAILTLPLHTNYGGNVQAFALQHVLKNMGHNPVCINYRNEKGNGKGLIRQILSKVKQVITNRTATPDYPFTIEEKNIIGKYHNEFISSYMSYTIPLYNETELKCFFDKEGFDAVIVGSDQVWRPRYTPKIEPFFFNFLSGNKKIKKISYAASFGTDVWEFSPQQVKSCGALIKEFDFISVRESLGVKMCQDFFNVKAEHVLDPTLLLDKQEYIDIFQKVDLNNNYGKIFNYILDASGDKAEFLNRVSGILGKEVFSTYPRLTKKYEKNISNVKDYEYPHIEMWLKSFSDADFVITDSFHGTVFSIIFNKPFISISNKMRGAARFTSLLEMFDLKDRLVSDFTEVNADLINKPIDFDRVNKVLNELRLNSLNLLNKSLSD